MNRADLEYDAAQKKERDQLAEIFYDLFEVDRRGQRVLEYLMRRFAARPPVTDGGIDAVLKTYLQDGERNVMEEIVRMINRGADGRR